MKLKDSIIIVLTVVFAIVIGVFVGVKITEVKNENSITNNGTNNQGQDLTEENDDKGMSSGTDNSLSSNKVAISDSGKYIHGVELEMGSRFSSLGDIIVTNAGNVYYVPSKEVMYDGAWEKVTLITDKNIGSKNTYKIKGYNESFGEQETTIPMEFEGYKLNLTNIQAAYNVYFGNGGESETAILVGKDGKINEFGVYKTEDGFKMVLVKNIQGYSNIVSVVPTSSISGHSALLIDKNGNYYHYYGYDYFGEE